MPTPGDHRFPPDPNDDPWIIRGTPSAPWISTGSRAAWPTPAPSAPATADCTCPRDCIRDHEHE